MNIGDEASNEVRVKIGRRRGDDARGTVLSMWEHATCRPAEDHGNDTRRWLNELFYPPYGEGYRGDATHDYTRARQICDICPIADACRTYATAAREVGCWGDTSADERSVNRVDFLRSGGLLS